MRHTHTMEIRGVLVVYFFWLLEPGAAKKDEMKLRPDQTTCRPAKRACVHEGSPACIRRSTPLEEAVSAERTDLLRVPPFWLLPHTQTVRPAVKSSGPGLGGLRRRRRSIDAGRGDQEREEKGRQWQKVFSSFSFSFSWETNHTRLQVACIVKYS